MAAPRLPFTDDIFRQALRQAMDSLGIDFTLKDFQIKLLASCIRNRVVACNARTAAGKSIVYIILPTLLSCLHTNGVRCGITRHPGQIDRGNMVLVIAPYSSLCRTQLASLIDQYPSLGCHHIKGSAEASSLVTLLKQNKSNVHVVFMTPETYAMKSVSAMFGADSRFAKAHLYITIADEAHNISSESYRGDYRTIAKQNHTNSKLCVMSGSMTMFVSNELNQNYSHVVGFNAAMDRPNLVETNQSRKNIYYHVQEVPSARNFKHLQWLVAAINEYRRDGRGRRDYKEFPKLVIYCESKATLCALYTWLCLHVPFLFLDNMSKYYIGYGFPEDLAAIEKDFKEYDSRIRVIIATKALGEGVDFKGLRMSIVQGKVI
jgi:superfamily II DNA helicase RecQ